MLLHGIYNYTVHGTTQYMGLRSTWDYAVHGTTQYMRLRGTWEYTVQETTRYRRLHVTGCYAVHVRTVHGTTPHLGLRSTLQFWNLAWICYPGRSDNDSTLKLVLKVIFVLFNLVCLFVSPGSGRAVRE